MHGPRWILLGLVLGLLAYDVYAVLNSSPGDTISEVVRWMAKRPIVPFVFGVIAGHLFWT